MAAKSLSLLVRNVLGEFTLGKIASIMLLEYSSLMLASAVGCGAMGLTLLISWLANRRDGFLLVWALSALVIVCAITGFGMFATDETSVPSLLPCALLVCGITISWGAAHLFCSNDLPIRTMVTIAGAVVGIQAALYAFDLDGMMFVVANAAAAILLLVAAREYWQARSERLASLVWLVGLYVLEAASFVACAVMLLIETPLHLSGAPQNWAETVNVMVSIFAVTGIGALSLSLNQERVARDHRLESRTDALTGLLNRRALEELYGAGRSQATAVIVFDLDHFKQVNDKHGHAHGDEVLRCFTRICKDTFRKGDVVARIGGEEFAAVLPGSSTEDAERVAERIRLQFGSESIEWSSAAVLCTVSAGVYGDATGKETLEMLVRQADEALYTAKKTGRNRVCRVDAIAVA